jgi:hypothetical protein
MARKKRNAVDEPKPEIQQGIYWTDNDAAWGGFINIRLDDEQKSSFHAWFGEYSSTVAGFIEDVLAEGMKVSMSYDRENQCHIATFTGALVRNSNERYVTTSRAGTLNESLGLAVWKHFFLADGDYGNYKPRTSTLMSWG